MYKGAAHLVILCRFHALHSLVKYCIVPESKIIAEPHDDPARECAAGTICCHGPQTTASAVGAPSYCCCPRTPCNSTLQHQKHVAILLCNLGKQEDKLRCARAFCWHRPSSLLLVGPRTERCALARFVIADRVTTDHARAVGRYRCKTGHYLRFCAVTGVGNTRITHLKCGYIAAVDRCPGRRRQVLQPPKTDDTAVQLTGQPGHSAGRHPVGRRREPGHTLSFCSGVPPVTVK